MGKSKYIHKSHNVSVLLYHFVFPSKYRRLVFSNSVTTSLVEIFKEIGLRYEIHFLEIGTDKDHVHLLVQSVPTKSCTQLVKTIKSLTAREIFSRHPEVKQKLWGGNLWTSGYFVNTVSKFGDESSISKYVKEQGIEKDYVELHKDNQLALF